MTPSATPEVVDGFTMPRLGLGTWQAPRGVVGDAVKEAIRAGYRLIDCAAAYGNEREIGEGLSELLLGSNDVHREDLFIVSKVFNTHHVCQGEDRPRQALNRTLKDLKLEYLDLLLTHWPIAFDESTIPKGGLRNKKGTPNPKLTIQEEYLETWKSMERLKEEGLVKHIGVSNFRRDQLNDILEKGLSKPVVNQIELHPYLQQPDLVSFCKRHGIQIMAYSPLGSRACYSGHSYPPDKGCILMENPTIVTVAKRHEKTPAQVLIQWSLQSGHVCIPKSAHPTRIQENFQVNNNQWKLEDEDMAQISKLDSNFRYSIGYLPGHYDCLNAPW
jgi:alcohol dehydrogenase (NADP+)